MSNINLRGSADSFSGTLTAVGTTNGFGPVGEVEGTAPPDFRQPIDIPSFHASYNLGPASVDGPLLDISASRLVNSASAAMGLDSIGTTATADLGAATISLIGQVSSTLQVLGLSVTGTKIHARSDASYVVGANSGFVGGDASFGSLTVAGSLIGGTLTFKGDAAANTVLFKDATVTITLDKQTLTDFLPPVPGAVPVKPNAITTDALDIQLTNAKMGGHLVTGDFRLGESSATFYHSVMPPSVA